MEWGKKELLKCFSDDGLGFTADITRRWSSVARACVDDIQLEEEEEEGDGAWCWS